MDFKHLRKMLFVTASLALLIPIAAWAETTGEVTFHKGWKKRSTPYNPVWGPSKCGNTTVRRVPDKHAKYRIHSVTSDCNRQLSDAEAQKIEELKKKLNSLRQIHEIQKKLLKGIGKISRQQQQRLREKIRQLQSGLEKDISETPDFPFPSRMHEIEQVVSEIGSGRYDEYRQLAGQSEQKILDDIHDRQIKALIRKNKNAK